MSNKIKIEDRTAANTECRICHEWFETPPDLKPTYVCNLCARKIVDAVLPLFPKRPEDITYEQCCRILNALQDVIYRK